MRTPHTSTYKGKTVLVILRDGIRIEDKFEDKKGGCIYLRDYGKVHIKDLRVFTIRKLKSDGDIRLQN